MATPKMTEKEQRAYNEALRRVGYFYANEKKETGLDLMGIGLTALPPEICQLTALTELYLSGNQLSCLPPEIGRLTALKSLDIRNNHLTTIPGEVGRLTALEGLYLSENQLKSLPSEIGRLLNLKELRFGYNNVDRLPAEIGNLQKLSKLRFGSNKIHELPREIGHLTALNDLSMGGNLLTDLPPEIGRLSALSALDLSDNRLGSLPPEIGQLSALTSLNLRNNKLSCLPPEIGRLSALSALDLSDNRLGSLPPEIGQLSALTRLDLDGNQLSSLPLEIRQLTGLSMLDLEGNFGLDLPPEVLWLEWIAGPNSRGIRPQQPRRIFEYYFRSRASVVKRPILEAKVILVGWGKVGKTSLRKRLVEGSFDVDESQTHKIEITPWPVTVGRDKVKLHVWDFGGQEIMHATHQFFLTKRSLYVLVLAGREKTQGAQEAEYWLRLIGSFGGGSPVLVVLNKQHTCPFDLNRQSLVEKYPFIKGFVQTDCEPETGLKELEARILAEVDKLPELRTEFDAKWLTIKDAVTDLKSKGGKRMSVAEFNNICVKNGENEVKWQRWLLGFLHDLGTVVCFSEDARLANDGVLDPQWVVDGIYTVLTEKRLLGGDGRVTQNQIRTLLPKADYTDDDVRVLVELMEKFELCFRLHDSRDKLVVPELMTEQETHWKPIFPAPEKCLRFELKYEFLPEGLVPRFIVATHDLSKSGERWRSGVILRHGKNIALVRGDTVAGRISIIISGPEPTRRDLLAVIRRDFAKINNSITGLAVKERVPVPGLDVEPIEYEHLLAAEEAEDKEWPVVFRGVRHKLLISTLLDGIEPRAKRLTRAKERIGSPQLIVHGDYVKGDKSMSNNTGTNYGIIGDGNNQTITDSFKVVSGIHGEELKGLFAKLNEQLSLLKDEMKGKDYRALEEHLRELTAEAEKPKPDPSQLSVSGGGLIEAAMTVRKIAGPVIATVGMILKFFGIELPQ